MNESVSTGHQGAWGAVNHSTAGARGEVVVATFLPLAPALLQLANVFFFGAALFDDVLLIRACLSVAYIALLVNNVVYSADMGAWALDGILWSLLIGAFHWVATYSMAKEELWSPPALQHEHDQSLWAYFHRRTGMLEMDFRRLHAIGRWVKYSAGEQVCDTEGSRRSLYILLEGKLEATFRYETRSHMNTKSYKSGDCLDYRVLNALGVFVGFPNNHFECRATGAAVLFEVPLPKLLALLERCPHVQALLRTYALGTMARSLQVETDELPWSFDAYGMAEEEEWATDGARSRDFSPLREPELAAMRATSKSIMQWVWRSIHPSMPPGCRHLSNPVTGSIAQARVTALSVTGLGDLRTGTDGLKP